MYGFISGYCDTDETCECDECGTRFGVVITEYGNDSES